MAAAGPGALLVYNTGSRRSGPFDTNGISHGHSPLPVTAHRRGRPPPGFGPGRLQGRQGGGRGQGWQGRQAPGGSGAGGGCPGQPAADCRQLCRHRHAGAAGRIPGGGQDLRSGAGGAGGGGPAGQGRAAAGAAGRRPRPPVRGPGPGPVAQAGEQLQPRPAAGRPATDQRRRGRPDALRPGKRPRPVRDGQAGAVLHHGGGTDLRGGGLARHQARQLRADQFADLPHRRQPAAGGHLERARARDRQASSGPAGQAGGRRAAGAGVHRQRGPGGTGGGYRHRHLPGGGRLRRRWRAAAGHVHPPGHQLRPARRCAGGAAHRPARGRWRTGGVRGA